MKLKLALSAAMLAISGCASTMSSNECASADWYTVGYEDGAAGTSMGYANDRGAACHKHGMSMDHAAYRKGRDAGLTDYCIPQRGYQLGLSGKSYNGVCNAFNESAFLEDYNLGREMFTYTNKVSSTEKALLKAENSIERLDRNIDSAEARLNSVFRGEVKDMTPAKLEKLNNSIVSMKTEKRILLSETIPNLNIALKEAKAELAEYTYVHADLRADLNARRGDQVASTGYTTATGAASVPASQTEQVVVQKVPAAQPAGASASDQSAARKHIEELMRGRTGP